MKQFRVSIGSDRSFSIRSCTDTNGRRSWLVNTFSMENKQSLDVDEGHEEKIKAQAKGLSLSESILQW